MNTSQKNNTLSALAKLLLDNKAEIIARNKQDIAECGDDIDPSLLDRLKVDEKKVEGMIASVEQVRKAEDPEGQLLYKYAHPKQLQIENRTVPFGRILIIYESRPDVTIEAAVAAFKSGNTILLKGGKEARHTNLYLVELWQQALAANGLDKELVSYLDLNRSETQDLILKNTHRIDLIIPRGGEGLIKFVTSNTSIPVIISGRGNNFLYIDNEADFDMALNIVLNGKSRLSVCNALDKVLFNRQLENLAPKVAALTEALKAMDIAVYGLANIHSMDKNIQIVENEATIMAEEFLSAKILFGMVQDMDEAIHTINKYSGGHSATIVTSNKEKATQFQNQVDCAAVYHNASTRFTDGGEFGFGAEIAISTQKLHFRGPVGLGQLVTNKWFINGTGQVR